MLQSSRRDTDGFGGDTGVARRRQCADHKDGGWGGRGAERNGVPLADAKKPRCHLERVTLTH